MIGSKQILQPMFVVLLSLTCTLHTYASVEDDGEIVKIDGLNYMLVNDEQIAIVCHHPSSLDADSIIIPALIKYYGVTYPVTEIGPSAFKSQVSIKSITIPNSVTCISEMAFSGCISLSSIAIPNTVIEIGGEAFRSCSSLTSIVIPNSLDYIPEYAFAECEQLKDVIIPNSISYIGSNAFEGCSSLTHIDIPNSITTIEDYSFAGCSGLTSLKIPTSVQDVGKYAFYKCTGLTSVSILNPQISIDNNAFYKCQNIKNIDIPKVSKINKYVLFRDLDFIYREEFINKLKSGSVIRNFHGDSNLAKLYAVGTWKMKGDNYVITITIKGDGTFTGTATQNDNYTRYAPYTGRLTKFTNKVSGTIKGKWELWDALNIISIAFYTSSTTITSAYSTINGHRVSAADAISAWKGMVSDRLCDFAYRPGNEVGHNQTLGHGFWYNGDSGVWHDRGIGPVYFYRVSTNKGRTQSKKR